MIIDFHTHIFPSAMAQRALASVSGISGGFMPIGDGTSDGLRKGMATAGIDVSVIAPIATKPSQMHAVNGFAAEFLTADDIVAFGSVHPDAPDALDELKRIADLGFRGIKLHPEYQSFYFDNAAYHPLYREIGRLGLITLIHAGRDIAYPLPPHVAPGAIMRALPHFNGAPVVAAHMGGFLMNTDAMAAYTNLSSELNLFIDTSFSYGRYPVPDARVLIDLLGAQHVLFGSDSPWSAPYDELRFVHSLGLDAAALTLITGENARRLLKI